ncbi:ABC transporter G family member 40 [Citrus sinensis]|nr:ABC transporter G family member 40 [Citrus sinensis]
MSDSSFKILPMTEAAIEANNHNKRGMVLLFEPHYISLNEIVYSVDMPQQMKLHGNLEDRLARVLSSYRSDGVSGAGKTTLMDVLAGRKPGGYFTRNITVSGYPEKQETFARILGYSWLRLTSEVNSETRKFGTEGMELVELNPFRQALFGLTWEFVANPSIISRDEPISGLDARAATTVIRMVRNTVDMGRTVVCTIHQPSIDIFYSFDELFLLKQVGQEISVGPLGPSSIHLISYFEKIFGVSKIKDGYNLATWLLEVTALSQERAFGVDFSDIYRNSELYKAKAVITELSKPAPVSKSLRFATQYSQSICTKLFAWSWKQAQQRWTKQQHLFNVMVSMYTAVLFLLVQNAGSLQLVAAVEWTIFYRESALGTYSAMPYALRKFLIKKFHLLYSRLRLRSFYAMIGFEWTAAMFFWYLLLMLFIFFYFTFYGMMAEALSAKPQIAIIVSSSFYTIWNLFPGFVIPRPMDYWASPVSWTWTFCITVWRYTGQDR